MTGKTRLGLYAHPPAIASVAACNAACHQKMPRALAIPE